MSTNIHSFEKYLRKWLLDIKPGRILEWGPGKSTEIMLECAPDAKIISFEHDKSWYKRALKKFGDKVELRLRPALSNGRMSAYAVEAYLSKEAKFDLIFVDGRRRVECLLTATRLVSEDGVVILHDADRKDYVLGIELYDIIEKSPSGDTLVMRKKRA